MNTFTSDWSKALAIDVAGVASNSKGVQGLSQKMADFLVVRGHQQVLGDMNKHMEGFGIPDAPKLTISHELDVVVNDKTMLMADNLVLDIKKAMDGKWPDAWPNLKDPLLLAISYMSGAAAVSKTKDVNWKGLASRMVEVFTRVHGVEALAKEVDSLDQLLPQVMVGCSAAILNDNEMEQLKYAMGELSLGADPTPSELLKYIVSFKEPDTGPALN